MPCRRQSSVKRMLVSAWAWTAGAASAVAGAASRAARRVSVIGGFSVSSAGFCGFRAVTPPHAPERNRVENVWAVLRSNKLGNRVFNTHDDIVDACCDAWNWFVDQPERVTTIASRAYAQVII